MKKSPNIIKPLKINPISIYCTRPYLIITSEISLSVASLATIIDNFGKNKLEIAVENFLYIFIKCIAIAYTATVIVPDTTPRSEERRVGKDGEYTGYTDPMIEKDNNSIST